MAADNNDHKILLIPSQNYASSVRSVISERIFTITGGAHSPSVVDTDFAQNKLLCLVFVTVQMIIPPTESEAHAIGVVGVVVVVATRSVDIVEVGSVVGIRRTQPHKDGQHNREHL